MMEPHNYNICAGNFVEFTSEIPGSKSTFTNQGTVLQVTNNWVTVSVESVGLKGLVLKIPPFRCRVIHDDEDARAVFQWAENRCPVEGTYVEVVGEKDNDLRIEHMGTVNGFTLYKLRISDQDFHCTRQQFPGGICDGFQVFRFFEKGSHYWTQPLLPSETTLLILKLNQHNAWLEQRLFLFLQTNHTTTPLWEEDAPREWLFNLNLLAQRGDIQRLSSPRPGWKV